MRCGAAIGGGGGRSVQQTENGVLSYASTHLMSSNRPSSPPGSPGAEADLSRLLFSTAAAGAILLEGFALLKKLVMLMMVSQGNFSRRNFEVKCQGRWLQ